MTGAELTSIRETFGLSASAMGKAFGYSSPKPNIAARIRRPAVGLALILVAIGLPHSLALANDARALIGRWLVPSREQEQSRMSPQCQQYAETDLQTVPESEIERSEKLRGAPIENLPVVWNIQASTNDEWPLTGDSYSPSSGYGAISCFKRPATNQVITKGCRRWGVELPVIGAPTCDCECESVCVVDAWTRK
jgi:hypothetical protein